MMSESCKLCSTVYNAHSFFKISENDEEIYYFSYPIKSRCNDVDGIVQHMTAELENNTKSWVWVINCASFGLTHLARRELNTVMTEFLSSDLCYNLSQIIIMNQTLSFRMLVNMHWWSIPVSIRKKVIFDTNKQFFNLLNLNNVMISLVA